MVLRIAILTAALTLCSCSATFTMPYISFSDDPWPDTLDNEKSENERPGRSDVATNN